MATQNEVIKIYERGDFSRALVQCKNLLRSESDNITILKIAAACHASLAQNEKAIAMFERILSVDPKNVEAYFNRGVLLQQNLQFDKAKHSYEQAIASNPDHTLSLNNLGYIHQLEGALISAKSNFSKALAINPNFTDAIFNLARCQQQTGEFESAIKNYKRHLELSKQNANTLNNLAICYMQLNNLTEARRNLLKALRLKKNNPDVNNNLGVLNKRRGNAEKAIFYFENALRLQPSHADANRNIAELINFKKNKNAYARLINVAKSTELSNKESCQISFALAKAYEDNHLFHEAFSQYKLANKLKKEELNYSFEIDKQLFKEIYTKAKLLNNISLPITNETYAPQPIFIIGMPRSGSTLIEQILGSHSKVSACGELDDFYNFAKFIILNPSYINENFLLDFREHYLSKHTNKIDSESKFFTDKMPQNFLFVNLIKIIFPDAKVIHTYRDAAATCWSNFKTYFAGNGLGYSYNLNDIVDYYCQYYQLMNTWISENKASIYHINYDLLVEQQFKETEEILQYLGLPWEEQCLSPEKNRRQIRTASSQQVRKKIYKGSNEKWKNFDRFIDGVFNSLPNFRY